MMMADQKLVEDIAMLLVEHYDEVATMRDVDEDGNVTIELQVNPKDVGIVIGKGGKTAQAIRDVLRAYGNKNDVKYAFKVTGAGGQNRG